jgi:putative ABC transport system permease protein
MSHAEDVLDRPLHPAVAPAASPPRTAPSVMQWGDLIGTAIGAIKAHPMRSSLTALGVVIGVASVVAMTSIGLGAQKQVESAISNLGSNLLMIMPNSFRQGGVNLGAGTRVSLTDKDAAALKQALPDAIAVSTSSNARAQLVWEGSNYNTQIQGAGSVDYLDARDWKIGSGRFFDDREIRTGAKVAVVGATIVRELFGGTDPVGQRFRAGNTPLTVVGVLAPKGQTGMQDMDDVVMAPIDAVRSRMKGRNAVVGAVDMIYVKGSSPEQLTALQNSATETLRERHKITDPSQDDFRILNSASILEAGQSTTETFTLLLGGVAAVSLLVGGVGIMNIMLVAVTERTREIGLRMALGARRKDILRQFAIESTALAVAGGMVGLLIGVSIAWILSVLGGWPMSIAAWAPPVAVGFSAVIGIGFGAYPAWQAAQLDPIEALRRD